MARSKNVRNASTLDLDSTLDFLRGGGEMGARMRATDWAETKLGAASEWPQSLRTAVSIMLESRFAMVVAWGPEFLFLYNDRYRPVLGSTKHPAALGRASRDIFPEAWDFIGPLFEQTRNGEAVALDDVLIPLDRHGYLEECFFTLSYSPIRDETGGVGGMLAVVAETTERVQSERQLALLRALAARTADTRSFDDACRSSADSFAVNGSDLPFAMIYLIDADKRVATLAATHGVALDDPGVMASVALDDDRFCRFADALATGAPHLIENIGDRFARVGAAEQPPHQAIVAPIAIGQSGKAAVLVAGLNPLRRFDDRYRRFIDLVSAQIAASLANAQAYEEERRRAEALAELDRTKTAFFSNVSHEFRTPLTLMMGPLEDALRDTAMSETVRNQLEVAHRNSVRLLTLVNTLLDFSRIEADRIEASYEPTDIAAHTAELASVFRSAIEKAGLAFVIDCPALAEPVYVDRDMWEKIVLNLISNAFKYTFVGEIRISLRTEKTDAVLAVADTGTGIPADALPHVFERFYRVPNARGRTHEGTGIGLALVHELVKLHGGAIDADSTVDRGTTFTVRIPLGRAHLPADRIATSKRLVSTATTASAVAEEVSHWLPGADSAIDRDLLDASFPASPASAAATASKPLILLADDNADMRDYVHRLLGANYRVIAVANGEEALNAMETITPDLVLTDVMMPKLDGFGLVKRLRATPVTATIPIVMLSARAGEEARVDGLDAGVDDYLVKPFSARELLARVAAMLKLARVRAEADERITRTLESITDGLIVLDSEWRYRYVNGEAERMLGHPRAQLLGRGLRDVFPEIVGGEMEARLSQVLAEGAAAKFEAYHPSLHRWYEHRAFPAPDGGMAIYFHDVTVRKAAEDALQFQAAVLEQVDDAVIAIDNEERVTYLNPAAERRYGMSGEQARGKRLRELYEYGWLGPIDETAAAEALGRAGYWRGENLHLKRDGTSMYVESAVSVLKDRAGARVGMLAVIRDVSERKRAEQDRTALRDELAARLADMTRLQELSTHLLSIADPDDVLQEIVKGVTALECADMGALALFDAARGELELRASLGLPQEFRARIARVPSGAGACGKCLEERHRVIVEDVTTDPIFADYRDAALAAGIRAVHSTPLMTSDGRMLGVLSMYFRASYRPNEWRQRVVDLYVRNAVEFIEYGRAQRALRESEERFAKAFSASPLVLTISSLTDGKLIEVNNTFVKLSGYAREEAIGRTTLDLGLWAKPEERRDEMRLVREQGRVEMQEYRFRTREGRDLIGLLSAERIDIGGEPCTLTVIHDITERKRAEERLTREQELLARIIDTIPVMITMYEPSTKVVRLNREFERLVGWSAADAVGESLMERCYPDAAYRRQVQLFMESCAEHWMDIRMTTRDGREIETSWANIRLPDDTRIGIGIDITQRKQAEQAARDANERLRFILDGTAVGTWDLDLRSGIVRRSRHHARIFGYDESANLWSLDMFFRHLHPDDRARVQAAIDTAIAHDREFEYECRIVRTDGIERWIWVKGLVARGPKGQAVRVSGLVMDVTERQQAEHAVRESEERFRMIADNIAALAWTADELGVATWYNKRWYEYTGTTFEELRERGWAIVLHADHVARVTGGLKRSLETGEVWEDTFPLRGRDGSFRWFLSRAVPIRGDNGKIARWFGTNVDITERLRMEEALKEADQRKNEFLATLAHELRNPLAPMRNGLEILRLARENREATERARGIMERQMRQMVRLIDDLLDLSRITRGKIELRKERVDLASVIQNAVETSRPLIEHAGHELILRVPNEPIYMEGDPTRLAQIFANLLNNAAKYTDQGGSIWLTVEAAGSEVSVSVKDNGVGIPAHMLPHVFEMFSRAHRSENAQGGLGIGLSIVQRLVEMHGGSVAATSDGHGTGAEFVVRMPILARTAPPVESPAIETPSQTAGSRVLVADDNIDAASSLAMMLRLMGHEVRTARDGLEAIEVAAVFEPQVVILDIGMPLLNGYDTCRRMREQPRGGDLTILAMTGWGQAEDKRRSDEAGFDGHLVKPVEPAAIEQLLAISQDSGR